ncbi:MAG: hypothetical protein ACQEQF_12920 [Bacillota bacterium]
MEERLGIKICAKHKEEYNYNCLDCCCYIMAGMDEVNRKYEPTFINPEYSDEVW